MADTLSIEDSINVLVDQARHGFRQRSQACEQRIRQTPVKAVLGAVAAGYCAHQLPMRALVSTNVRLLASLVPPALVLLGAAKVYEYLLHKQQPSPKRLSSLQPSPPITS
jgi:hypothetical protein